MGSNLSLQSTMLGLEPVWFLAGDWRRSWRTLLIIGGWLGSPLSVRATIRTRSKSDIGSGGEIHSHADWRNCIGGGAGDTVTLSADGRGGELSKELLISLGSQHWSR
jgi:hypothetical protein